MLVVGIMLPVFVAFGFYNRWWRYVSTQDMWGVLRGVAVAVDRRLPRLRAARLPPARRSRAGSGSSICCSCSPSSWACGCSRARSSSGPLRARIVARGKEVLIVGAGDAAQLILREMLRNPALGYTPIGLVDDDPRKKNLRLHGVRVLGTTAELPELLRERRPDELLIAIPSASGDVRERIVAGRSRGERPGQDAAGAARAHRRRLQPDRPDPPGRGRGPPRPRAGRRGSPLDRGLPRGRGRARHRCGRLDRLRAVPPDRAHAARRGSCSSTTASRASSRSSASSSTSATSTRPPPCSPTPGTRRRCGRSSRSTGRRSSSTPPRTSTCRSWRRTRSRRCATTRSSRARSRTSRSSSARSASSSSRPTRPSTRRR